MSITIKSTRLLSVIELRHLTPSAYILKFERGAFGFQAGQYISLGTDSNGEMREYSIYSGESDDYIEVLIREVEEGLVSKQLKHLTPGDKIKMGGPYGFFTLNREAVQDQNLLMIGSGTGIAPFHSYIRSYPGLNYTIVHGVRYGIEAYEKDHYNQDRYILCTSRDHTGHFHGRVTGYLEKNPPPPGTICYLCGNSNMIHEVYEILTGQGIQAGDIRAEVYF
jgi:ferredoxin--NADP+ reductase/benzoate/toluate 1,2-dioxygenase reductase subunit